MIKRDKKKQALELQIIDSWEEPLSPTSRRKFNRKTIEINTNRLFCRDRQNRQTWY